MVLIIGGAYQGKLGYAKKEFPEISEMDWVDGRVCGEEELYVCRGIHHFHAYIERMMREGRCVDDLAGRISLRNPKVVIISDEIGYGIVPADPFEREYREMTGRICTRLAADAKKVCRVVCGIGTVIKG